MIEVTLTPKQIAIADDVGRKREGNAVAHNFGQVNGAVMGNSFSLRKNIEAARCECAGKLTFSKMKWHAFYPGTARRGLPDLELDDLKVDVKAIDSPNKRLIVQLDDPDDWIYVLALSARHPTYELLGWLQGHKAKQQRYWTDPNTGRPAFFIPTSALQPMAELREVYKTVWTLGFIPAGIDVGGTPCAL